MHEHILRNVQLILLEIIIEIAQKQHQIAQNRWLTLEEQRQLVYVVPKIVNYLKDVNACMLLEIYADNPSQKSSIGVSTVCGHQNRD